MFAIVSKLRRTKYLKNLILELSQVFRLNNWSWNYRIQMKHSNFCVEIKKFFRLSTKTLHKLNFYPRETCNSGYLDNNLSGTILKKIALKLREYITCLRNGVITISVFVEHVWKIDSRDDENKRKSWYKEVSVKAYLLSYKRYIS